PARPRRGIAKGRPGHGQGVARQSGHRRVTETALRALPDLQGQLAYECVDIVLIGEHGAEDDATRREAYKETASGRHLGTFATLPPVGEGRGRVFSIRLQELRALVAYPSTRAAKEGRSINLKAGCGHVDRCGRLILRRSDRVCTREEKFGGNHVHT